MTTINSNTAFNMIKGVYNQSLNMGLGKKFPWKVAAGPVILGSLAASMYSMSTSRGHKHPGVRSTAYSIGGAYAGAGISSLFKRLMR